MELDWYFDVISPYAYLQLPELEELAREATIRPRPVLLAALLDHWGQLGPAEIPPKRTFTYRHVKWLAARDGVPMHMPAAHPFNPLMLLRLACVVGDDLSAVRRIFEFVWAGGGDPGSREAVHALAGALGVSDPGAALREEAVKARLRANGRQAIDAGVFGVPTLVAGAVVLWGSDAAAMARDLLRRPGLFGGADDAALAELPQAARRPAALRRGPAA